MIVGWLERVGTNAHLLVGTHVASSPRGPSSAQLETLEPSVDSEFSARRADDDTIADHERCHGGGLTVANIRDLGLPDFSSGTRIDRHGVPVEQVVDDLPVCVERTAIH